MSGLWLIAQQATRQSTSSPGQVLAWVAILIVAVVVLGLAVLVLRRKLLSRDDAGMNPTTLMESLRQMRDSGEMSSQEYDAVRKKLAGKVANRPSPNRSTEAPERTTAPKDASFRAVNRKELPPGGPTGA